MIKAIVFDMNGILIDDEHIHEMATMEIFKKYGQVLTHQEFSNYCGASDIKIFTDLLSKKLDSTFSIEKAIQEKHKIYLRLFPANKKTYPGVMKLVKLLSSKFPLALASNAFSSEVYMILNEFRVKNLFQAIVTGEDVKKPKPDPEPYALAVEKLGLKPSECVAIEDSPPGVASAKKAGMHCIAVTTTHKKEDLEQADKICNNFDVEKISRYILDFSD